MAAWEAAIGEVETLRDETLGAAGDAQVFANAAAGSAGAASTSAGQAASSAGAAADSATQAGNSATSASTSAGQASTSANEANTARQAAEDAAASIAKGKPNGTGSLDADGRQPEAEVPERLTPEALSGAFASIGESVYATPETGIQAALDAAHQIATEPKYGSYIAAGDVGPVKATVVVPAGVWSITAPLRLPDGVTLHVDDRAIIKATAAMSHLIDTDITKRYQGVGIYGGIWDCNNLAQAAIYARWAAHFTIDVKQVRNCAMHGIIFGDPAATGASFEGFIGPVFMVRPNNQAVPAGSVGVWIRNATDCTVGIRKGMIIVGQDIQVRIDGAAHTVDGVHPWGFASTPQNGYATGLMPTNSFYINAPATKLIDCYADGVKNGGAGYYFTANATATKAIACSAFLNPDGEGTDNSADAFYFEAGARVSLHGPVVRASSTKRWRTDYAGDLTNVTVFGQTYQDVVTVNRPIVQAGYSSWASFTPTLFASVTNPSLGTGATQYGRYRADSYAVEFSCRIIFGTGATAGDGVFELGCPAAIAHGLTAQTVAVGSGWIYDSSANTTRMVAIYASTSNSGRLRFVCEAVVASSQVGAAIPWAWSAGDSLTLTGRYERAAT
ncbi:hypothetical protein [Microbacterium testaceum]|uniref:hypothetical protein n=1 Tax=Microbacterium testaceum TaxID=2033 RepID=UPI001D17C8A4|nr:hypothetical protein [Microbacterium testaceum]MCC4249527.1 hypothetical protein [Microbacterium testaceum]